MKLFLSLVSLFSKLHNNLITLEDLIPPKNIPKPLFCFGCTKDYFKNIWANNINEMLWFYMDVDRAKSDYESLKDVLDIAENEGRLVWDKNINKIFPYYSFPVFEDEEVTSHTVNKYIKEHHLNMEIC